MAGLDPAIHVFVVAGCQDKDTRDMANFTRDFFFCGRAVDERDVALTQGAALLRVILGCGAR
jgi:hypothetical protein